MPFVTQILPQKRRANRFNVYLDGKYAFPVSEEVLLTFRLKEGTELSDDKMQEVIEAENYQKFYLKVLDFLSYQPRSRDELVKRLHEYLYKAEVKEEFSREVEAKIMSKLEEMGLINDEEFVKNYISLATNSKNPPGPRKIKEFLFKKGVEASLIDKHLADYSQGAEVTGAKLALEKKLKGAKIKNMKEKQKYMQFLLRKGFSYGAVRGVVDSLSEV